MSKAPTVFETAFESYQVVSAIGEGGSGQVFAVSDSAGEKLALKCLRPASVTTQKRKRFKNEIQFCSKVNHPNIIRIRDFGVAIWNGAKVPFYVMPQYQKTLRDLLNSGIAPSEALPLFAKILDGVEAAHLNNVFHRDIKPENILVGNHPGDIVVADFGIAHFEADFLLTSVETKVSDRLMNHRYAAPEQRCKGAAVDHRADIYALGLLLNEMYTGVAPHGKGHKTIIEAAPQYGYLDPMVDKMLQQEPAARYSSISEIKGSLIGLRQEFVERQKLDQLRNEVIPARTPIRFEPLSLVGADFEGPCLVLKLNRSPEDGWQQEFFQQRGGYSMIMGACEPKLFDFRGANAKILFRGNQPQQFVELFKQYVLKANEEYPNRLKEEAEKQETAFRLKLEHEVAERERKLKLLQAIHI